MPCSEIIDLEKQTTTKLSETRAFHKIADENMKSILFDLKVESRDHFLFVEVENKLFYSNMKSD